METTTIQTRAPAKSITEIAHQDLGCGVESALFYKTVAAVHPEYRDEHGEPYFSPDAVEAIKAAKKRHGPLAFRGCNGDNEYFTSGYDL